MNYQFNIHIPECKRTKGSKQLIEESINEFMAVHEGNCIVENLFTATNGVIINWQQIPDEAWQPTKKAIETPRVHGKCYDAARYKNAMLDQPMPSIPGITYKNGTALVESPKPKSTIIDNRPNV